jgi:ferredoxin
MKIHSILVVVIASLFLVISGPTVFACELAITPGQSEVVQNEKLEMIAYRKQVHKKCNINMDDIHLESINCTIDQQTLWVKEGYTWSKKFTVSFSQVGDAYVKLVYECEKHPGDVVPFTAKIVVKEPLSPEPPKEEPPSPPQPNPPPKPENPPPSQPSVPSKPSSNPTTAQAATKPSPTQPNPETYKPPAIVGPTQDEPSKEISVGYVQQNTLNTTQDPYPNPTTLNQETVQEAPKTPKKVYDFFLDQSFYLVFMLLFLSMILYLFRLFKLRYFVNLLSLGVLGFYLGGCICPIGMFERIGFLERITPFGLFSLLFLVILFIVSLFFGRIFCGWICPQGALQEVLFHGKKSSKVSPFLQKVFVVLPLLILLTTLVVPFFIKTLVFCKVDPFKFAFQQSGSLLLLILFVIFAIGSVLFYRPFCRAFCPLGLFLGIGSWIGKKLHLRIFSVHLTCHTCSTCSITCQVDALCTKGKGELMIEPTTCIECGDCQITCLTKKKILQKGKKLNR